MKKSGRNLLAFALLSTTLPAHADPDKTCISAGQNFSRLSSSLTQTINSCFKEAVAAVKLNRRVYAASADGSVKLYGYGNLIYIKRGDKLSLISGPMSTLHDIRAVAISSDGALLAVLNGHAHDSAQDILVFKASQNGNVVPLNINSDSSLGTAQSLAFSEHGDQLLVPILPAEVAAFDVTSDSRSPLVQRKPNKKSVLNSGNSVLRQPVAVAVKGKQIVAIDRELGVIAYDTSKTPKLLWQRKNTDPQFANLKSLDSLFYNSTSSILYVMDSVGNYSRLSY